MLQLLVRHRGQFPQYFHCLQENIQCIANRPAGNLPTDRRIQMGGSLVCCGGLVWFCYQKEQPTPICTVAPECKACESIHMHWAESLAHTVKQKDVTATEFWNIVCGMLFCGIVFRI